MKSYFLFKRLLLFILLINLNLNYTADAFFHLKNDTDEKLEIETNITGTDIVPIAPGESKKILTGSRAYGKMSFGAKGMQGFNIWRTYYPRDWTGLLGVWKNTGGDPENYAGGSHAPPPTWTLSIDQNKANLTRDQWLHQGKYKMYVDPYPAQYCRLNVIGGCPRGTRFVNDGIFYQGSDAAWTQRFINHFD